MSKEPLLTRKALREHVVQQRNTQEQQEIELNDSPIPKKPFLESYNRFLTIWMIVMIVLIIVVIGVQIFL